MLRHECGCKHRKRKPAFVYQDTQCSAGDCQYGCVQLDASFHIPFLVQLLQPFVNMSVVWLQCFGFTGSPGTAVSSSCMVVFFTVFLCHSFFLSMPASFIPDRVRQIVALGFAGVPPAAGLPPVPVCWDLWAIWAGRTP